MQPGDTLVDIAEQHGLDSWQPIFDLNAGEPVPGGGRFTDPDLIRPGQVLDLPVPAPSAPAPVPPPLPEPPAPVPPHGDGSGAPADSPPTEPTPPTTERPSDADAAAAAGEADADQETPSELAAVLSGSGALLAAGVGAAWLAHRRRRLRRRRSGRRLAPLPAALSTTQTAVTAADAGRADYAALDRALRGLAVLVSRDPDAVLPDVVAARLDGQRLDLRLHTATDRPPPAPWTADETGRWWSLELDADLGIDEVARARLAPYPTLVTIGTDDGRRWLLDLECVGVLRLTGPADRCEDFARHLAAELGVNAWSDLLTVTTVGFGQELVDLAPERIRPVGGPSDTDLQAALGEAIERDGENALEGRLHATTGTGWMPHVVLAPLVADDGDDLAEAATTLESRKQRSPIVVVLGTESTQKSDEWLLTLTEDGHLSLPTLDVRLPAPQLTAQQARDIATLLAFERDTADQLIPAADGNRPWQVHTDAAGALRGDVLLPDESEPPDHVPAPRPPRRRSSVAALDCAPQPVDRAALAAPTAGEDAAAVDRTRTPGLRKRIEDDLEQLDRDLADWWDPDCARPRLALLGPVSLRAHGDEQAAARSGLRRRYEEAVAYLATRPHGATVDEAATALQPARGGRTDPVSARAYVHRITAGARAWLGTDPITGEKHLSSGHRGPYTLTNVLVDADLFRQLRARASVRGDDGMPDLLAALELVSGPPFAQRPTGYEWLDGLDLTLAAAICDVAHQVVTAALADDLEAARTACDIALLVAPDDEKVLLDAVWVAYREGHRAEAEMYIARIVVVHDGADEMDLPLSTAEIINRARRQYSDRAS
ncbi:LysM peptidoglycan-binding domain-containing protein [Geodermatophilus sp. SYSU D01186]